jgi:hypothetical protein
MLEAGVELGDELCGSALLIGVVVADEFCGVSGVAHLHFKRSLRGEDESGDLSDCSVVVVVSCVRFGQHRVDAGHDELAELVADRAPARLQVGMLRKRSGGFGFRFVIHAQDRKRRRGVWDKWLASIPVLWLKTALYADRCVFVFMFLSTLGCAVFRGRKADFAGLAESRREIARVRPVVKPYTDELPAAQWRRRYALYTD